MKYIIFALLSVILLAFPSAASADIAPPAQPPGSNLQPGEESTRVRMLAETVLIDVQPAAPADSLGRAHVTADFTMRNLGQETETMAVRFPTGASDGWFHFNEIRDLQVRVDGQPAPTHRILGEDPYGGQDEVAWAEFDATFPTGRDIPVRVQYTLEASGEYPFIWFRYILSSGAGWKDSIGRADVIVRLPYAASNQNLLLNEGDINYGTTPGGMIEGNKITWRFEELEPNVSDNFEINLVMPAAWETMLTEQSNVKKNPNDGEAWGRLGKLYKEMTFSPRGKGFRTGAAVMDSGAAQLYGLSIEAYKRAVTLKPADALWHTSYADLLSYHAYFAGMNGENVTAEITRALNQIRIALELSPNDPKVREIADRMTSMFPNAMIRKDDAFDFPWLTATPALPTEAILIPTATSTSRPVPTKEAVIATPTGSPASPPSLEVCGIAAGFPLLVLGLAIRKRLST